MGSRVEPQSLLHGKTLVANTALVRHLSGVGSHVDGEAAMGVKTDSSDSEVGLMNGRSSTTFVYVYVSKTNLPTWTNCLPHTPHL